MFINFAPHFVRIRKDKTKKIYPVIAMEVKKVKKDPNKEYKIVDKKKKKNHNIPENAILFEGKENDDEDIISSKTELEIVEVWICIGDDISGEYLWLMSDKVRFLYTKARNKIKKPL